MGHVEERRTTSGPITLLMLQFSTKPGKTPSISQANLARKDACCRASSSIRQFGAHHSKQRGYAPAQRIVGVDNRTVESVEAIVFLPDSRRRLEDKPAKPVCLDMADRQLHFLTTIRSQNLADPVRSLSKGEVI